MQEPQFTIGQQVKFNGDHDRLVGKVLSFSFSPESGYVYTISSSYYDAEQHALVDGVKICREEELVDMTDYAGKTGEEKPTHTVNLNETVATQPTTEQPTQTENQASPDQATPEGEKPNE